MEFLFRPRSSGKRQVKPSQDIAYLEEELAGEESDDSEFKVGKHEDDDTDDDSSGGRTTSSDDDDSSDDEGGGGDVEVDDAAASSTNDLLRQARSTLQQQTHPAKSDVKVCGCCLGQSSNDANEIVECDGCGVSVHEGCYGVSESTSVSSEISAASTEPWFCEPCRAGINPSTKPPPCELCPLLGGIYKRTDVGRWVHLVCALYIPGVAFGDPENLSHVTIFEMSYAEWGKRACGACMEAAESAAPSDYVADTRTARTGVCIQCDAGMCKSYFHASCAQANGLLCEPSYHDSDPYLAHCRIHTDKSVIRRRKQSYLTHQRQVRQRAALIAERVSSTVISGPKRLPGEIETEDQRILRKLRRHQDSFRRDRLLGRPPHETCWVPTQKMPRMLTTSASALQKLTRMGEIKGVSAERQRLEERQALSVMEARKKWHVPPAFSVEYVAYFHDRGARLDELKKGLADQLKQHSSLRERETMVRPRYDLQSRLNEDARERNEEVRKTVSVYRDALAKIVGSTLPDLPALKPMMKPIDIVTPNVRAKATVWSSNGGGSGGFQQQQKHHQGHLTSSPRMALKSCGICKRTKDQHLLVLCDTCLLHYHLGCLTPPLSRMPHKSKLYGWQCSECDKDSSSNEEDSNADFSAAASSSGQVPQRRRRQAAERCKAASAAASRDNSDFEYEAHDWTRWQEKEQVQQQQQNKRKYQKHNSSQEGKKFKVGTESNGGLVGVVIKEEGSGGGGGGGLQEQQEAQRRSLIASASASALKEEKRRKRRMEKERRRAERRKKRKEKEERLMRERGGDDDEDETDEEESENECEVIELENGQTIVNIKPKPIKLKIKNPTHHRHQTVSSLSSSAPLSQNGLGGSSSSADLQQQQQQQQGSSPRKRKRKSATDRDVRTKCDKCLAEGANENLVRCDKCKKCYHFQCLVPPLKKSPKVAGYGWNCTECDSDVDTDWHLD